MFHASADNLDELMRSVFKRLLSKNRDNRRVKSRKGGSTEVFGALLELTDPRARLGRSMGRARVFSPLGELVWYLSGSDALDQIRFYISWYDRFSDDGIVLNGAYGPRIFAPNRWTRSADARNDEWQRVIDLLRERDGSRNAVIQIYSNADGAKTTKDVPCTCTLQFVARNGRLHMHVHMRSNDAFLGLPHDVFSFTMLQEIAARELGMEIGTYQHSVASLHLYDDTEELCSRTLARRFLDEGLHDVVPMPPMARGDPWASIGALAASEKALRLGEGEPGLPDGFDPYWGDLVLLLKTHATGARGGGADDLKGLIPDLSSRVYRVYILDLIEKKRIREDETLDMFREKDGDAPETA